MLHDCVTVESGRAPKLTERGFSCKQLSAAAQSHFELQKFLKFGILNQKIAGVTVIGSTGSIVGVGSNIPAYPEVNLPPNSRLSKPDPQAFKKPACHS